MKKLLIVNVAALGLDLVSKTPPPFKGLTFKKLETIFPAVTCSTQASFRTGRLPNKHGMVANGRFFPDLKKMMFWEQSARLVDGERIWREFREKGNRVGLMFWQQGLGEDVDLVLSPKPIHKHVGGIIQDCYSQPHDLYKQLTNEIGRPFKLAHYWGPLASKKSSDWIVKAMIAIMKRSDAPELLIAYLPHLDYKLQRHGTDSQKGIQALTTVYHYIEYLYSAAKKKDTKSF